MNGCYNCGSADHFYRDCPLREPGTAVMRPAERAEAHAEHLARIHGIVHLWLDGRIGLEEKRRAISDENRQYYGPGCRSTLLWPLPNQEAARAALPQEARRHRGAPANQGQLRCHRRVGWRHRVLGS